MTIRKGRILAFNASGHDDTAKILIDDYDHGVQAIYCDFVRTLKSFEKQFGGVMDVQNRISDLSPVIGEEILYMLDNFGTIAALLRAVV